ncbi:MAG: RNA 2',3'-cyclic phosphodiesterase [Candidatus Rokubacteria bacterium]|nr:RNA 2',3'-cyclic phosphodiesterase [Candidatus Rokubacteria bacterium]
MSGRIRAFVAILLDSGVREAVAAELERLRPLARSVSWVPTQNLHLTFKFLGEIQAEALEAVKEALVEGVAAAEPFTLTFHGLGAFPGLARPRVIWVGVARGGRECQALQAQVDAALNRRGFPKDARAYTPHLTIGRVRDPRGLVALQQAITQNAQKTFGDQRVSAISLMRSDLHPSGARYTELSTASFPGR